MDNFSMTHVRTSRAGSYYYNESLARGHVEIYHDQKRYVYDMRGYKRPAKAFKNWIRSMFDDEIGEDGRLVGSWPRYSID